MTAAAWCTMLIVLQTEHLRLQQSLRPLQWPVASDQKRNIPAKAPRWETRRAFSQALQMFSALAAGPHLQARAQPTRHVLCLHPLGGRLLPILKHLCMLEYSCKGSSSLICCGMEQGAMQLARSEVFDPI